MLWRKARLERLVLVPYRPFRNLSLGLGGVILLVVVACSTFYLGYRYGVRLSGATPDEVARLRQTVSMYAAQSLAMRDQASIARHDQEIVLAATEQLRQQNKNLLSSISGLEEQVSLYKRILNPRQSSQGISIEQFELHTTQRPGRFAYKLMLTQGHSTGSRLDGKVEAVVEGSMGGKPSRLKMPVGENTFSMEYFANLVGEWQLPAGFVPERINITVSLNGRHGEHVERKFKWEVTPA